MARDAMKGIAAPRPLGMERATSSAPGASEMDLPR
jgi:hypothetical protein